MSSSQVGYLVTANIITAFGGGILYGLYQLAGDYLTTFFFMIIFAVALASIRISVVNSIQKLYETNSQRWSNQRIYFLHQAKFGITFNLIINLVYCIRYPFKMLDYLKQLFTISSIPYIFIFYVIVIKLQCLPQLLFWDVLFWACIDLLRIITYPFKRKAKNDEQGLLEWISKSKLFNTMLFASVLLGMILILPIAIALIYQDIMIYKEDLIPKLQKYQIPNEYKYYLSADFLLSQLQGQYLSESQIQQLSSYLNPVDVEDNHKNNVIFLEIFYGEHALKILGSLKDCQDSKYCQAKVLFNNLNLLNDQIYEYMQYGYNYFNAILPQLQQFASVIGQFLIKIFSGSVAFLVKFIIFQQGVMYLLTESSFYDLISVKEKKNSFKGTLVQNISKHITGVFVSLFTIFYVTLYVIIYPLYKVFLIGLLSLTQIVDPGLTFTLITGIWWLAGFLNDAVHEFCINDGLTILLAIGFYFQSGSIYLNTFQKQLGDAYWSAMSVILGYISFQWQGLLIGPLLIGGVRTLYEILAWYWGEREILNDDKSIQNENQRSQGDLKPIENKGITSRSGQSKKEGKKKKD
ncbi:unnamed protein product (macronuclear) [Paramecium tetraurelia]|uniref:Transmembrane protein n=1 Tax=Paramecium tetraurelia TaxID=5888 RepID=A0C7N2_PARTE|nr:uncharacterized protein GSPATT00035929001 [Paramecium tetraurelia]CAK66799.1 unnamed protein product [Paramecium tetraurelia]|eukprot:XP_001434196.1 hypothetical protein (macronuclear) [Paramecium tetraurelia strain d4-2]